MSTRSDVIGGHGEHGPAPLGLNLPACVSLSGTNTIFEGIIEYFTPGAASIILDHKFQMDAHVEVDCHGFQFSGDVVYSEPRNGVYEIHIATADVDDIGMRRSPRYVMNIPARVHVPGPKHPMDATILNVSKDGMGLETHTELEVGEGVCVENELNMAFATVRHCRRVALRVFRIGLEVHYVISRDQNPSLQDHSAKLSWLRFLFAAGRQ